MTKSKKDEILALLRAVPERYREATWPEMIEVIAREDPGWLTTPIGVNEAADFLGITAAALRQRIHRGDGPPVSRPGRGKCILPSRLELMLWMRSQIEGLDDDEAAYDRIKALCEEEDA